MALPLGIRAHFPALSVFGREQNHFALLLWSANWEGSSESACGAGTSSEGHEVVKGLPREAVNEAIADCLKCERRHCPASPWASHYWCWSRNTSMLCIDFSGETGCTSSPNTDDTTGLSIHREPCALRPAARARHLWGFVYSWLELQLSFKNTVGRGTWLFITEGG